MAKLYSNLGLYSSSSLLPSWTSRALCINNTGALHTYSISRIYCPLILPHRLDFHSSVHKQHIHTVCPVYTVPSSLLQSYTLLGGNSDEDSVGIIVDLNLILLYLSPQWNWTCMKCSMPHDLGIYTVGIELWQKFCRDFLWLGCSPSLPVTSVGLDLYEVLHCPGLRDLHCWD